MSQSVTIKSNKYGINFISDADITFAFFIKAAKVFIIIGMNKPSVLFMFKREK